MGGVMMRKVNHERIGEHAEEIRQDVVPDLKQAGHTLNKEYDLEGGDFSITCTAAAVAYPGAIQFAFNTLKTHVKQMEGFAEKLDATATNWQLTEEKNTFKV